jgi:UTP-glucose-1-phosphate uridylyltransferase
MAKRVRKAVLPVAGLGTRVLPGAKTTPKNLLNVVDRPILSYIVEEARAAGIEHFVFIVGRGQGAIEDYLRTTSTPTPRSSRRWRPRARPTSWPRCAATCRSPGR